MFHNAKKLTAALTVAIALTACGDPRLDGSSLDALTESSEKMMTKLSDEKEAQFGEAMQVIALKDLDVGAIISGRLAGEDAIKRLAKEVDGKTADEVIAHANAIKAERAERERLQALEEIAELEARLAVAEDAKIELAKFSVSRSRFYLRERQYSYRNEPIIEMAVQNGTQHPISRARFKGTISSPDRSIPWLVEDFSYSIAGGLEPGEAADWTLAPNAFGPWGSVSAPDDAVFTVEVVRLDGPDGETLFDASGLSERDLKRLSSLKEQYQ